MKKNRKPKIRKGYVHINECGKPEWDTFTEDTATYAGRLGWIHVEVVCYPDGIIPGIFTNEFTSQFM